MNENLLLFSKTTGKYSLNSTLKKKKERAVCFNCYL